MNKIEYKITTIPDKIIIDENAVYEFGILPANKPLTINEYDDNPTIKLLPIERVDRLNNIIDELEKYCESEYDCIYQDVLDKLKELKEGK